MNLFTTHENYILRPVTFNVDFSRCHCRQCHLVEPITEEECLHCREINQVVAKLHLPLAGEQLQCITQHPGFKPVILDVNVLETAYLRYWQQYGPLNISNNE